MTSGLGPSSAPWWITQSPFTFIHNQSTFTHKQPGPYVTHAGNEFKAWLLIRWVWEMGVLRRAVTEWRLWMSKRSPEEVSHFGEAPERGRVRVLNEPLQIQPIRWHVYRPFYGPLTALKHNKYDLQTLDLHWYHQRGAAHQTTATGPQNHVGMPGRAYHPWETLQQNVSHEYANTWVLKCI